MFGLVISYTFRLAMAVFAVIVIRTMDIGPPWWLYLAVAAVFLVIPLLVAVPVALLVEIILTRAGSPDRSSPHVLYFVPAAALAVLPLILLRGPQIARILDPAPPSATNSEPARQFADPDSFGFCAPPELAPGESLQVILTFRWPRAVDAHLRVTVNDQNGREYMSESKEAIRPGVNRIRVRLGSLTRSTETIAWPLRVVDTGAWTLSSDDYYGDVLDVRSGSLAFFYRDR